MFFLQGPKIIFRISMALIHLMRNELMKAKEFSEIFETLETFPRKFIDYKTLIQTTEMPKFKITNREIRDLRIEKREKVEVELQSLVGHKEKYTNSY
jgi:hypothetical protein